MYFNIKFCTTVLLLYFTFVTCKKSFTIILDSTESMRNEISIIKRNFPSLLKEIGNLTEYENYVLLPFSDPGE